MALAYLCIFVAAAFFAAQFIFSKLYQRNSDGSILANMWMSILQGVWILLLFFTANGFRVTATPAAAAYALLYAFSSICCSLASIKAVSMGKIATVTLYSMIGGQAVPFVYGILFTHAQPTWLDYLGFALILASCLPGALAPQQKTAGDRAPANRGLFLALCMVVFFGNGFVSVFSDVNAKSPQGAASTDFLILAALWMLLLGFLVLTSQVLRRRGQGAKGAALWLQGVGHAKPGRSALAALLPVVGIVGAYTVFNSLGNIFSLRAAGVPGMQSSIQFPILNATIMVLTTVLGRVVFGEKVTRRDLLGLFMLVGGILLMMLSFVVYGH